MNTIGIDPDSKKSGVATYNSNTSYFDVTCMTFFELYDYLKENKEDIELIRIEAGWMNEKSNFHYRVGQSKSAGERIAKNVGANHETGRKIVEMCDYLGVRYELVKPLGTKNIDHFHFKKITGIKKRTNQDMRDAGMLLYHLIPNNQQFKTYNYAQLV